MTRALRVVKPGMLTTVQDLGRWGRQSAGVPVAGPMDMYSHRLANRLAGNPDGAAALEVTIAGPELQARGNIVCAVAGARFSVEVDGTVVDITNCFEVMHEQTIRFGARHQGARATLAVRGGFDVAMAFGSRSTNLVTRIGPFGGRALAGGDELPVGTHVGASLPPGGPLPLPAGGTCVRVMLGPHDGFFTHAAVTALLESRYTVTPQSNRMGYRLTGAPLPAVDTHELLSQGTPFGSLQVPASGQPILLMADRQTTGGYPRIATVISADLPRAGQLAPGDWIEFASCTRSQAIEALRQQEADLGREAE